MNDEKGRLSSGERRAWLAASAVVAAGIALLSRRGDADFRPYFGGLPPVIAALTACGAGVVAIQWLRRHHGFAIFDRDQPRGSYALTAAATLPFMAAVTCADLLLGFPADMNLPLPEALVFYPAMGFVALCLLHLVPFALLLRVLDRVLGAWPERRRIWLALASVALVETTFQVIGTAAGGTISALEVFVALHLFCFSAVEMCVYWRQDFAHMLVFRLTYYAWWHVAWALLRLQWIG